MSRVGGRGATRAPSGAAFKSRIVALDTGRGMRRHFGRLRSATLSIARAVPLQLCAVGDYRCHLFQAGPDLHACGLDRSYEIALYVYARLRPLSGALLLCGNGLLRDAVAAPHARLVGGDERDHVYTHELLAELAPRVTVRMLYVSRGVYDDGAWQWRRLLGARNVGAVEDTRDAEAAMRSLMRIDHG